MDDNDRLLRAGATTYTYDPAGNTLSESTAGSTTTFDYDGRNRLTSRTSPTGRADYAYDADGLRVGKTDESGTTTDYLVDTNRPYRQVLYERTGSEVLEYTYGMDLIGLDTGWEQYRFHSDALGSTRLLTDGAGTTADDLRYDAWGEILNGGTTPENMYRYAGEQFDPDFADYYLRARYYSPASARFSAMDTWRGDESRPVTLNKYAYANGDPVMNVDRSGLCATSTSRGRAVEGVVTDLYRGDHIRDDVSDNKSFRRLLNLPVRALRPDIINVTQRSYAEIKPLSLYGIASGRRQMAAYASIAPAAYLPDRWSPRQSFSVCGRRWYAKNAEGIIFYTSDQTIRSLVASATTVALIAKANASSRSTTSALRTLNGAISLLNRASSISARYAANGIRTAVASRASFGLSFGLF